VFIDHEAPSNDMDAGIRVLELIVASEPSPSRARMLKKDVLRPLEPPAGCRFELDEVVLLRALVSTQHHRALNRADMDVAERGRVLSATKSGAVGQVLSAIGDPRQPFAQAFLESVVDQLTGAALGKWARQDPAGVLRLAEYRPELSHEPEVWRSVKPKKLWSVAREQRGSNQRLATLLAIVSAQAHVEPAEVLRSWRNGAELVLRAISEADPPKSEVYRWLRRIPEDTLASYLAKAESPSPVLVREALEHLSVDAISRLPVAMLRPIVDEKPTGDHAAALLAAALQQTSDPSWVDLGVAAFERFATAPRDQRINAARNRLDLARGSDGDVRKKAATAINRALKGNHWRSTAALTLDDREAFRAVIEGDRDASLARRLLVEAADSQTPIKAWQHTIISKAIASRSDRDSLLKTLEGVGRALRRALP
jgi:hypothetical protein